MTNFSAIPDDAIKIWDSVASNLSAEDIANLSATSQKLNKKFSPLVPVVLIQEISEAASGKKKKGTLEAAKFVAHMDTGSEPVKARKKINYLSEKKQMATRAMNGLDKEQIIKGESLRGKGKSSSIKTQVDEGNSRFISASSKPQHKFSRGSSGHIGILTPQHHLDYERLNREFPKTLPSSRKIAPEDLANLRSSYQDHSTVLEAVKNDNRLTKRVREAHEVMFRDDIPLSNVILFDKGLPKGIYKLSKAAKERHETKGKSRIENIEKWLKLSESEAIKVDQKIPKGVYAAGKKSVTKWHKKNLEK